MLKPKQQKCLKLMITGEFTQREIAEQINVSEKTICQWKKDNEFMHEYDELLNRSIKSVAAKAFNTQANLLNSKNDMVKYLVSKDILDRAGYKPEEKINVDGVAKIVFEEDLNE